MLTDEIINVRRTGLPERVEGPVQQTGEAFRVHESRWSVEVFDGGLEHLREVISGSGAPGMSPPRSVKDLTGGSRSSFSSPPSFPRWHLPDVFGPAGCRGPVCREGGFESNEMVRVWW